MEKRNKKKKTKEEEEVDRLLQVAQDEVLLNLSIDSHMSRFSSDLFQALKSKSSSSSAPPPATANQPPKPRTATRDDDLFARFAALKASSASSAAVAPQLPDDEEDEVEKIIRWAKDAARLDPSPPSDDDEDDAFSTDSDAATDDNDGSKPVILQTMKQTFSENTDSIAVKIFSHRKTALAMQLIHRLLHALHTNYSSHTTRQQVRETKDTKL